MLNQMLSPESDSGDKSFYAHIRGTLFLGLPIVGAQLAQMGIGVTDTIMIGWLGARELASSVLGTQLYFIVYIFGGGISLAIVPIIANALGSGDERIVRRSMRMGLWAVIIYSIFGLVVMSQQKAIYMFLGQEPANIALAEDYLRIAMWGVIPSLLSFTFRSFLTALELARIVFVATIGGVILNVILNYLLIFGNFGAPRLEIEGAAWASLGTQTLIVIILAVYLVNHPKSRTYEIFTRLWRPDWEALIDVVKIGLPIGIGILAEVGLFQAASVMMGWLGTIELAAHGVALQIASVAFMVPLGLSSAATVRVGIAFGSGDRIGVARAANAGVAIALSFAVATALVLVLFSQPIASLFLDSANADAALVLRTAVPLLLVAAAFQLVDSVQVIMTGVLRGIGDINTPTKLVIFSYWLFGVPLAYFLGFKTSLGGVGIWVGLASGLAMASILLFLRFGYRRQTVPRV